MTLRRLSIDKRVSIRCKENKNIFTLTLRDFYTTYKNLIYFRITGAICLTWRHRRTEMSTFFQQLPFPPIWFAHPSWFWYILRKNWIIESWSFNRRPILGFPNRNARYKEVYVEPASGLIPARQKESRVGPWLIGSLFCYILFIGISCSIVFRPHKSCFAHTYHHERCCKFGNLCSKQIQLDWGFFYSAWLNCLHEPQTFLKTEEQQANKAKQVEQFSVCV